MVPEKILLWQFWPRAQLSGSIDDVVPEMTKTALKAQNTKE